MDVSQPRPPPASDPPVAVFDGCLGTRASPVRSKGTSALFVGEKSRVKLEGPVVATTDEVRFRFDEVLLHPARPTAES